MERRVGDSDKAGDETKSLLAFVHVPKTGGTSLEGVFLQNEWPMFNIRHPEQARDFLNLSATEQAAYRGVFGHMPFGIDHHVSRPVDYITFLRHPVERTLSAYAHNLRHPDEPGADVVRQMGIAWTAQPSNFMCRFMAHYDFLGGTGPDDPYWWHTAPPFVSRDLLEQAKANLARCKFIGLTESYDQDVQHLARLDGHPLEVPEVIARWKTGDNRMKQSELTREQIEAIRAANRLDMELYEYALALRKRWGGPLRLADETDVEVDAGTVAPPKPSAQKPSLMQRLRSRLLPSWSEADLRWKLLPSQTPAGSLPQIFAMPPEPYVYGAATSLLRAAHCVLQVRARVQWGQVGLMLTSPDGSNILSPERVLTAADGWTDIDFALSPDIAPAILVTRGMEAETAGRIEIGRTRYGAA